jgi:DNA-binding transcriptional ArsR family regulator
MIAPSLDVFQVIADPSRRHMMKLLSRESMTINNLAEHFDMSRPAVSKHVRIMNEAGFITITDIGRERYCTLRAEGFLELKEFITYFDGFWTNKLQKLQHLLDQKKKR